MTKNILRLTTGLCAVLTVSAAAQAADFTLYNDIRSPIIGFYTQRPDGSWSSNWLSSALPPGEHTGMKFGNNPANAACVRNYRIVTSGDFAGAADRTHDFCKYRGLHMTAGGPTHSGD